MKINRLIITIFISIFIVLYKSNAQIENSTKKFTIVIHGGVGTINRDIPDSVVNEYKASLSDALSLGVRLLEKGELSLNVVEQVVRFLEDDPKFNAGKGSVFTSAGSHELDASIMDGRDLSCGAVAGVKTIKNPISLARLVMEKTPHVLLIGEGAEKFGELMKVETVPNEYFTTPKRFEQWQRVLNKNIKGTVGCVALDVHGNLAAATSTGGTTNKMPGRVGDTPIIGAGTYADNQSCAVSCTGRGELFIKNNAAYNVSALMKFKGYSLEQAAKYVIYELIKGGDGGLIAVDKYGNYTTIYNTNAMYRGSANSEGLFEVKIWE